MKTRDLGYFFLRLELINDTQYLWYMRAFFNTKSKFKITNRNLDLGHVQYAFIFELEEMETYV